MGMHSALLRLASHPPIASRELLPRWIARDAARAAHLLYAEAPEIATAQTELLAFVMGAPILEVNSNTVHTNKPTTGGVAMQLLCDEWYAQE